MKQFKVAAISRNTNSFGLHKFILIAEDGEVWFACKNKQYASLQQGDVVDLGQPGCEAAVLSRMGFELPERGPHAPPNVVDEVWKKAA
jgi:hypothetical protein